MIIVYIFINCVEKLMPLTVVSWIYQFNLNKGEDKSNAKLNLCKSFKLLIVCP
jgi:hypothetical protein